MFLSTFEKQLEAKRRVVVQHDFRAGAKNADTEGFGSVFCFPSIEADCLEGGGDALFKQYLSLIEELPFGDPLRSALETTVLGGHTRMAFDSAGRITLPEALCDQFGLTDWVAVVGMGDRFQIWSKEAFDARRNSERMVARTGLAAYRNSQRTLKAGAAG